MAHIKPIESVFLLGCLDPMWHWVAISSWQPIWCWVAIGSSQPMQESPGANLMAEVAGSDRGRRRLVLAVACRGRARRLTGVWVFSSYEGRFLIRFSPTGTQRQGECVYANLKWWRAAMKPGNGEAARSVLVDGEGGLRWCFGSKDVRQGFLELPSSFSTDQLLRSVAENSNLVDT
jgi:hypothetical protein